MPTVLFGLLETVLRLLGYGYNPDFFIPATVQNKPVLVENARFGLRFFPPELARSPSATLMPAEKTPNTYRIFILGESAALGDPRPAYGVARYLEALLRERYPGTEFEVVCAAMTAINSHVLVPIARECAQRQGDLWVVYMGNNEYVGPFGPNTVFGPAGVSLPLVRAYTALQATRTGQWLASLSRKFRGNSAPTEWSGLKMFKQNQIAPGDPRRGQVTANLAKNLEDIVKAGIRARVPIVLSTMAVNLRDCAPFGSLHSPSLSETETKDWEKDYQAGAAQAAQGQWAEAAQLWQAAEKRSPKYAELQFRLGQCGLAQENASAASTKYRAARDWDALPFRADSSFNQAAADTAQRHANQGVVFVDADKELSRMSPGGVPGREFFYEHVHLTCEGNYQLARLWAEQIQALLPTSIASRKTAAWADQELCNRRLGLSPWNRFSIMEEIARRLQDAPYTGQFNHTAQSRWQMEQLVTLKATFQASLAATNRALFEAEVQRRPEDRWLHQNYAEFLENVGDLAGAIAQWQIVRDQIPHHHAAYYQMGRLQSRAQQYDAAKKSLLDALRIRPDLTEANMELGVAYAGLRQWDDALKEYDYFQQQRPRDSRVYLRRAEVLAAQTKRKEAVECLRKAIEMRSSFWEARYYLGVELVVDGNLAEAQKQFEEVVKLRPDHAQAHFNLAVAYAKQNQLAEAVTQFKETLRCDPNHKQAQQYLEALRPK